MALVINDRVKETSATTGTGTFTLAGAVTGFETFSSAIGNTNTTYYTIVNENGEFEVGLGTVAAGTLARTTIISSSNSDSAVNFSSGTKDVFCTLPASKAVILDSSGNIVANNGSNLTNLNATNLTLTDAVAITNSVTGEIVPGKIAGTNFTRSLLVGHATHGTLNTSEDNTGVGVTALNSLTTGDFNTGIGSYAVHSLSTNRYNTGVGYQSLRNSNGEGNTGIGTFSVYATNSGTNNTGIGRSALISNTSGDFNTALGYNSGRELVGNDANYNLTLGAYAGDNITSGAGNVIIGSVDAGAATGDRQLKIAGYDGTTTTTWISGDSDGLLTITGGEVIPGKLEGTNFTSSLLVGHATTGTLNSATGNTGVGIEALDALTSGFDNVALGYNAGSGITTGKKNILLGKNAGDNITTGTGNVIIGNSDAASSTGHQTLKISGSNYNGSSVVTWISGDSDGLLTITGGEVIPGKKGGTNFTNSLLIGHSTTGTLNDAGRNTGGGIGAFGSLTRGDDNTVFGYRAGAAITENAQSTLFGSDAGKDLTGSALGNTAIGYNALQDLQSSGNFNIGLGHGAGYNLTSGGGNVAIGKVNFDSATGSRQLKIAGNDGSTTTTWISGDSDGLLTITGGEVIPGKLEGTNFANSLLVGHSTTGTLNAAENNTAVGVKTMNDLTSGDNNTAVGSQSLENLTTGIRNTSVGFFSQNALTTGQHNISMGHASLAAVIGGVRNTAVGSQAGNKTTGNYNTYHGYEAGKNIANANYNVNLGWTAGDNITSGSGNVSIGAAADPSSATGSRQLTIGGYDGSTTTTWISGDSNGNLVTPGTITANSVVLTGVAADDSITLAKMAPGTDGNLITYDTSGDPAYVATGSAGQVLTSAGAGAVPSFQTPTVGDITAVTAGSGLTGGGATGDVTLNVGAGTGIDVSADAIAVDVSDFMANGANNRIVTATGTDAQNAEANLTFDGSTLTVTGAAAVAGHITPGANDTYDLGASGNVWRNVYTGDLHLTNEAKTEGNAVDGTKGNWTIQEGSEDLYILNNKSGKKYKFKLEEI